MEIRFCQDFIKLDPVSSPTSKVATISAGSFVIFRDVQDFTFHVSLHQAKVLSGTALAQTQTGMTKIKVRQSSELTLKLPMLSDLAVATLEVFFKLISRQICFKYNPKLSKLD